MGIACAQSAAPTSPGLGLWLFAGEDRSIPTPATVAILDQLIASGRPYQHVVFPGFGHNLFNARFWPQIDNWLEKVLK